MEVDLDEKGLDAALASADELVAGWPSEHRGLVGAVISRALTAYLSHTRTASPAPTGWMPIESAPRDGTPILVSGLWCGIGPERHYAVVVWDYETSGGPEWRSCGDLREAFGYLTHWMPLPSAPTEST